MKWLTQITTVLLTHNVPSLSIHWCSFHTRLNVILVFRAMRDVDVIPAAVISYSSCWLTEPLFIWRLTDAKLTQCHNTRAQFHEPQNNKLSNIMILYFYHKKINFHMWFYSSIMMIVTIMMIINTIYLLRTVQINIVNSMKPMCSTVVQHLKLTESQFIISQSNVYWKPL